MARIDVKSFIDFYEQRLSAADGISEFEERSDYLAGVLKDFQKDKQLWVYSTVGTFGVSSDMQAVADMEKKFTRPGLKQR